MSNGLPESRSKKSDVVFDAFDFDGSGQLDIEEYTVLMRRFTKSEIPRENVSKSFELCGGMGCIRLEKQHFQKWVQLFMGDLSDERFDAGIEELLSLAEERKDVAESLRSEQGSDQEAPPAAAPAPTPTVVTNVEKATPPKSVSPKSPSEPKYDEDSKPFPEMILPAARRAAFFTELEEMACDSFEKHVMILLQRTVQGLQKEARKEMVIALHAEKAALEELAGVSVKSEVIALEEKAFRLVEQQMFQLLSGPLQVMVQVIFAGQRKGELLSAWLPLKTDFLAWWEIEWARREAERLERLRIWELEEAMIAQERQGAEEAMLARQEADKARAAANEAAFLNRKAESAAQIRQEERIKEQKFYEQQKAEAELARIKAQNK